jgi:DNA-binding CsgD family transcriptional regulator
VIVASEWRGFASGKLVVGQVRELIRLLNEARDIPGVRQDRVQHLVTGVARIVGASLAGSLFDRDSGPVVNDRRSVRLLLGRDAGALSSPALAADPDGALFTAIRSMMLLAARTPGAVVTATWHELVIDGGRCTAERAACVDPAGLAGALFSAVRLSTRPHIHGIGLYRPSNEPPFSEDERNLVHVFHAECAGLLDDAPDGSGDEPARARLSPRQRQTLELVLNGLCDKEIADRLGISRFTVNQYTKAIYRYYAVTSRTQLLARVLIQPPSAGSLIIGNGVVASSP